MNELEKSMTINGVEYVERTETPRCSECVFVATSSCHIVSELAKDVFDGDCVDRNVIYMEKEKEMSNDLVPNWRDLYAAIGRGDEVWRVFSDGSKAKWSGLQSVRLGDYIYGWEIRKPVKKVMMQHYWAANGKYYSMPSEDFAILNYKSVGKPYELEVPSE
jgi:hypothetical protein